MIKQKQQTPRPKQADSSYSPQMGAIAEQNGASKQGYLTLNKTEETYRLLFEKAPIMHVSANPHNGTILDCSDMIVKQLGYQTSESLIGRPILSLYHEECLEEAQEIMHALATAEPVDNKAISLKHLDGSKLPVIVNVCPVHDAAGNLLFSSSTWFEINKLTETEKRFAQQNAAFEQVLEGTMAGYWDWMIKEGTEYLSPTFKKMFGYEDDEMENSPESWQKIIHPDDLPNIIEAFNKHVETQGEFPYDNEVRYFHKNGDIVWVLRRGKVIEWDEYGNPVRMVGSHVDITPSKNAFFKLQKSEERRRHMIDEVKDYAIIFLDVSGKIKNWNLGAERMQGFTAAEVMGKNFRLFYPEEAQATGEPEKLLIRATIAGYVHDEGWRLRKNGERFWASITVTAVLDTDGTIGGFTKVIRDLTVQKQAEEAAKKYAQEVEVNTQLKQFAYIASHDMQEPLRTISSYLQLLSRRYKGQLDADADEFIEFAVDGANRMKALIDDLLSYAKIDTEAAPAEEIDLEYVLSQVQRNLHINIKETDATISHDPLPTVRGNASQFIQLFQNLLANGIKFQKPDVAPQLNIIVTEHDDKWQFAIQDNGIGLDQQYADRIFSAFQRLHNRQQYAGTGIGLATCKKIVKRHGGDIWVKSAEGEGATFFFTLSK